MTHSKAELRALAQRMRAVAHTTYWLFFTAKIGAECHAFIEFNGLISKYIDIAERAAEQGIDFTRANVHNAQPLPVEVHDLEYLAEKLACIFGPILAANPEAKAAFKRVLFGEA